MHRYILHKPLLDLNNVVPRRPDAKLAVDQHQLQAVHGHGLHERLRDHDHNVWVRVHLDHAVDQHRLQEMREHRLQLVYSVQLPDRWHLFRLQLGRNHQI